MTDFETTAKLSIEVDPKSLRDARNKIEDLGDVEASVATTPGGSGGGSEGSRGPLERQTRLLDTGVSQRDDLISLAETRNRLLEERLSEAQKGNVSRLKGGGGGLGGGAGLLGGTAVAGTLAAVATTLSELSIRVPDVPPPEVPDIPSLEPPDIPPLEPPTIPPIEIAPPDFPIPIPVTPPGGRPGPGEQPPEEINQPEPGPDRVPDPEPNPEPNPDPSPEPDPDPSPGPDGPPSPGPDPNDPTPGEPVARRSPTAAERFKRNLPKDLPAPVEDPVGGGSVLPEVDSETVGTGAVVGSLALGAKALQSSGSAALSGATAGVGAAVGGSPLVQSSVREDGFINDRFDEILGNNDDARDRRRGEGELAQRRNTRTVATMDSQPSVNRARERSGASETTLEVTVNAEGVDRREIERKMEQAKREAIRELESRLDTRR
jgi:hypothetical protein